MTAFDGKTNCEAVGCAVSPNDASEKDGRRNPSHPPSDHYLKRSVIEAKSTQVLDWVKYKLQETLSLVRDEGKLLNEPNRSCPKTGTADGESKIQTDQRELIKAIYGSFSCAIHLGAHKSLDELSIYYLESGTTNMCFHVWDGRMSHQTLSSSFDLDNSNKDKCQLLDDNSGNSQSGIFIKVGFLKPRWALPDSPEASLCRLDREGRTMNFLNEIYLDISSKHIMCATDEAANDNSRMLMNAFFADRCDMYIQHFKKGKVDVRPSRTIGSAIAKLHVYGPSRLGKDEILDTGLIYQIVYPYEIALRYTRELVDYFDSNVRKDKRGELQTFIQSNSDFLLCFERHLKSIVDPPPETATFVHFDTHVRNILVKADLTFKESHFENRNQVDNEVQDKFRTKLVDFEFSNWGPSGVDLGLFTGSALFYSLAHACLSDLKESQSTVDVILSYWRSYSRTRVECLTKEGHSISDSLKSLYHVAHETLGWTGAWLFRLCRKRVYFRHTITNHLYTLGQENEAFLHNVHSQSGDTGFEVLRVSLRVISAELVIMGYGDSTTEKLSRVQASEITLDMCDEVIFLMTRKIYQARNDLRRQFELMSNSSCSM